MQEYSMCSNGPISKVGIVAVQQGPIFKGWQVKVRHHTNLRRNDRRTGC